MTAEEDPLAKLYVSYLPQHYDSEALKQLFSPYGTVMDSKIIYEPNGGPSKGYGFVRFDRAEMAAQAIYALNSYCLEGRNLVVRIANKGQQQQQQLHSRGIPHPPPPPPPTAEAQQQQQQSQQYAAGAQSMYPAMYGYMDPQMAAQYGGAFFAFFAKLLFGTWYQGSMHNAFRL